MSALSREISNQVEFGDTSGVLGGVLDRRQAGKEQYLSRRSLVSRWRWLRFVRDNRSKRPTC